MKIIKTCIGLAFLGLGFSTLMAQELKDDPAKEWCYLKKSTTVLGMPYNSQVTEVTYDGALYTGYIELNFAAGSKATPLLLRQKTFLEGWIPVVGDTWKEDGLDYSIQMFAAPSMQEGISNCLNFVKISVKNATESAQEARLVASLRGKLDDSRFVELQGFTTYNTYEVKEKSAKTLMPKEDSFLSNIFNLTIWPAEYFGIQEGETITRIEYIFTNKDGTLSITGTDDKIAAEGGEVEGEKEPFICELACE